MTATTDILQDFHSTLRGLDASAVEILDDSRLARALYSSDASIYRVVPAAVAHPRSTDELCALVTAASHVGLPVTTRGAGTTCAGNAVGTGLIINTSAHLNRILSLDPESATADVEPGVVQDWLQHAGAPHQLRFGPDPSTSTRCTMGGMIGNNACGPRALGYGRTGDNIVDLDLLTADGHVTTLRPGDLTTPFAERLGDLADANLATIRTEFATFSRQVSGYSMEWLLPERGRNLPAFIAGTEATLGIVTKTTVRLVREAPYGLTAALGYPSMPEAADAVTALLPFSPVACEGFGRRIVDVVSRAGRPVPDLPRGDGWMFVELRGDDEAEVASRAKDMVAASGCLDGWVVSDPVQAAALWKIRADGAGLAGVLDGREEVVLGNLHREVVMTVLDAEVSGVTAATADHRDLRPRSLEQALVRAKSEDRRMVAVGLGDNSVAGQGGRDPVRCLQHLSDGVHVPGDATNPWIVRKEA